MITVELPWPDKTLSPNARAHHMARANAVKAARELAAALTREKYLPSTYSGELVCTRIFHPPDNRRRDLDNMGAMCKAYQDGIFDALGLDDSRIVETVNVKQEKRAGGLVIMRLEEFEKHFV